jgi:type II secretory ATPase GspE/PulE/Tfp pilus assembly ATPase PilB-like protein
MEFSRGTGCASCRQTGYRGRVGLFELAIATDAFRDAITRGATRAELREIAAKDGTRPLVADGWSKVVAGITTIEEVLRVAQH